VKKIFAVISSIILILLIYSSCYADTQKKYHIEKYLIDATIDSNGDIIIEENITYSFTGQFNGVTRDIGFTDADDIILQKVIISYKDGRQKDVVPSGTDYESGSGTEGTYAQKKRNNILYLKIFEPSYSELKTFTYVYKLDNVVKVYDDIAEFYWGMIDDKWESSISDISIIIDIPLGAAKEELKVWAHGPLEGLSEIVDENTFRFTLNSLPPGTLLEARLVFPKKLVPGASRIISRDGLQDIINEETGWADEANTKREEARKKVERTDTITNLLNILSIPLVFVWIFLVILFYIKFDREPKPRFDGKYYRDIPSDITPAEVSYLMSFGGIYPKEITATLLDLVQKGYLKLESVIIKRKRIFGTKEIPTYQFSFADNPPPKLLKAHETRIISWFINEIGENGRFTLEDIMDEAKGRTSGLTFKRNYDLWVIEAKKEGKADKFLDTKASHKGKIIGTLAAVFYFFWGVLLSRQFGGSPLAVPISVLGVIMFLYSVRIKKRTAHGAEEHSKWKALKKFLLNFSRMDKKDIPEHGDFMKQIYGN